MTNQATAPANIDFAPQPHPDQAEPTQAPTPAAPAPDLPPPEPERKPGNPKTKPPHPDSTKDVARTLYIQGLTLPAIADSVGVPLCTVQKWSKRNHWATARAIIRNRAHQAALIVTQSSLSAVSKSLRADLAKELQQQANMLKKRPVKGVQDMRGTKYREGRTKVVKTLVEAASIVCGWEDETKIGLIVPMCGPADQAPAEVDAGPVVDVEQIEQTQAPAISQPEPEAAPASE